MTYSQPSLFDLAENNRLRGRLQFQDLLPSVRERVFENSESLFNYMLENQERDALNNGLEADRAATSAV